MNTLFYSFVRPHLSASIRSILGLLLAPILSGCFGLASLSYTGDGRLSDKGALAYASRYAVDLGAVDATRSGSFSYRLSRLPRATFTVNIEVIDAEPNILDKPKSAYGGRVRVLLKNSAGEIVIDEDAPLQDWVRTYGLGLSTSSFYRRGEARDISLPNGNTRGEQIGVKASGGWGTYFNSEYADSYNLKIEIVEPLRPEGMPTRVTLMGFDR